MNSTVIYLPYKKEKQNSIILGFLLLLLSGCSHFPDPETRAINADAIARDHDMKGDALSADEFVVQTYYRLKSARGAQLTIYLEGDGFAWASRSQPSFDPTPINPVALKMAAEHEQGNVAYLARPCQYLKERNPRCNVKEWTDRRFSEEVIASINAAVDQLKEKAHATRLRLVGFSGGGAVAVLLAERRNDIDQIVTVAGNIDPVAWTGLLHLSPLAGSLDPMGDISHLEHIPQVHLVGGNDKTVPLDVAKSYRSAFSDPSNVHIEVIPGFNHHCCWAEQWPQLQKKYFSSDTIAD